MSANDENALTRKRILQNAAEFDPESIRYLSCDHQQIVNIDALREFKNLVHLNLSFNSICILDSLKEAKCLTYLNLSSNKVTNIDSLGYLEALEDLNLAGNLLTSSDRLRCLSSIATLRKLRLQDAIHGLTNPLCRENGYQFTLLDMISQLVVLDGERVKGRGSDLYKMCYDLDKQIETFEHSDKCPCGSCLHDDGAGRSFGPVVERAIPQPWFQSNQLKFDLDGSRSSKSEMEFEKVLRECKKLDETVANKIEAFKQH